MASEEAVHMSNEDVEFLENYCLAVDRLKAVDKVFDDDTVDYWYYSLLSCQVGGDEEKLALWQEQAEKTEFVDTVELQRIFFRQHMIDYGPENAKEVSEYLQDIMEDVKFDHERDPTVGEQEVQDYPCTLQISTEELLTEQFKKVQDGEASIQDLFTAAAGDFLSQQQNLTSEQIGEFLDLMENEAPDISYLLSLLQKDLQAGNVSFGERKIYQKLTREKMQLLATKMPELLNNDGFLIHFCRKLRPIADSNIKDDRKKLGSYLKDLHQFADKFGNNHASLKGLITYNYLKFVEEEGQVLPKTLVKNYLRIPRKRNIYCPSKSLPQADKNKAFDFTFTCELLPELDAIIDEEPLIRRAVALYFLGGDKTKPWDDVMDQSYSLPLWAETMLVEGKGNEKFTAAQIETVEKFGGAGAYRKLRDRVDLDLAPKNKQFFNVDDEVELVFFTKNNSAIEVAIYDINAKNYYKRMLNEIPLDINLSGSSPIGRYSLDIEEPPIRRLCKKQKLPQLKGRRGVFLIEFIGNGVSARALVRKGQLRYIKDQDHETAEGYVFKVFNEQNKMVENARIWVDGVEFFSGQGGNVQIPFGKVSNERELIILEDMERAGSATLQQFAREAPVYKLECGMYIDREQLLRKKQAHVIIRANLYLNQQIVSLNNLTNIQFKLNLEDNQGNEKTRINEINLDDNEETVFTFTVPTELRKVECILTCTAGDTNLMSKQLIGINEIDDRQAIADMFMFPSGGSGYVLSVQGKNGEVYPNKTIKLSLSHKYFCNTLDYTVQSDENGCVYLGRLYDVETVEATCNDQVVYSDSKFELLEDCVNVPKTVHVAEGDVVRIPFIPQKASEHPRVHVYDEDHIQSFSDQASFADGYIVIKDLPAGDFVCYIRDFDAEQVSISVTGGVRASNALGEYVIGKNRVLQLSEDWPLTIKNIKGNRKEGYTIELDGTNEKTRLHLFCCSMIPVFNCFGFLGAPNCAPDTMSFRTPMSTYLSREPLNAEYKYIMDRKHESKNVGNLLAFPSLLNNGWTQEQLPVRTKDPQPQVAKALEDGQMVSQRERQMWNRGAAQKNTEKDKQNLEFLGESSAIYFNKKVDDKGVLVIDPKLISEQHTLIQVLAVDDDNTCLQNIILDDYSLEKKMTDVRLTTPLPVNEHFTEIRKVVCLSKADQHYLIEDFSTAEYEPYETLEEPFNLYRSLAGERCEEMKNTIKDFEPLIRWDQLNLTEKLSFYDRYCCNEVNLFLSRKDKEFFDDVCVPCIQNKCQKSFMDKYLLGSDLKEYRKPFRLQQLNALERIFLAERTNKKEWTARTLRYMKENSTLEALNPTKQNEIFNLAINSRQLGVAELDKQLALVEERMVLENIRGLGAEVESSNPVEDLRAPQQVLQAFGNQSSVGREQDEEQYLQMTREYQETGYYKLNRCCETTSLIQPTRYWADYAEWLLNGKDGGFLSQWFLNATSNHNEMLCALAVLDIPLSAEDPQQVYLADTQVKVLADKPVILFLREIIKTTVRTSAISVSTNYFDPLEKTHTIDGEEVDKFISNKFSTKKVYGCRIVVTNVSSVDQTVEILCQIPQGSIPGGINCFQTQSWFQTVEPFGTYKREYYFYWPEPGSFRHFPVHINKNGQTVGYGLDNDELVVETITPPQDTSSWRYISNLGAPEDVLGFLESDPAALSVDLSKICWRFNENPDFFDKVCQVLRERQIYDNRIWAYSVKLDNGRRNRELSEFLAQNEGFRGEIGRYFKSDLVTIDSNAVRDYQIKEFWPFLDPRAHKYESSYAAIDSSEDGFKSHYYSFLERVAFSSSSVSDVQINDKLIFTCYLLLRNRIQKAKDLFKTVDETKALKDCEMVYKYIQVYLSFHDGDVNELLKSAQEIAKRDLPNSEKDKWLDIVEQLRHRKEPTLSDPIFLLQQEKLRQEALQPYLEFETKADHQIVIRHRNVADVTVNFYKTELELMFSMHPFQDQNISYRLMMPNITETIDLKNVDGETFETEIKLPESLLGQNTIVEMKAAGLSRVEVNYDNKLDVQVAEEQGEIRVLHSKTKKPLERAYVKVYAQNIRDGKSQFYKDGYSDLRGRFDYRTLSTDQLRSAKRLSILVSTEKYGSVIKEVDVPLEFITRSYLF